MEKNKSSIADIPLSLTTNDFGTERYVDGLVKFITNSAAPITIALQGEWGSGKTSLMNRLYNDLCTEEKDFIGININTWEYSMLSSPEETVLKIIVQLVKALSENDPKPQKKLEQVMKGAANWLYRGAREFAKGVVPGAGVVIEAAGLPAELTFDSQKEQSTFSIADLKEALTNAIANTLSDKKKGVVIFVDDLDRLNPPLAVQILELLKNVFTLDKCIFVLAIDYDVVVKGLEPKFGKISESNEREFRSFFDKIIQVPFSLPVNNYKPLNFVLDSLESINYISHAEKNLPFVQKSIEKIVVSSVGKNPRSIKRLINTLSLLDCIAKCTKSEANMTSLEVKVVNFAIVAIQVCYPKIYNILTINPIFKSWGGLVADKLNLGIETDAENEIDGEEILEAICNKDVYLGKHHSDILNLLLLIDENALLVKGTTPEVVIREIMDRSSLTSISVPVDTKELDKKAFIYKLHENVKKQLLGNGLNPKFKRNTGNGGLSLELPNNQRLNITFAPVKHDGKIRLRITLETLGWRPDGLKNVPYEDILGDVKFVNALKPMEETVSRLSHLGIIQCQQYSGIACASVIDELRARRESLMNLLIPSLVYDIVLKSASDFEDPQITTGISELVVSAYDMKKNLIDFIK